MLAIAAMSPALDGNPAAVPSRVCPHRQCFIALAAVLFGISSATLLTSATCIVAVALLYWLTLPARESFPVGTGDRGESRETEMPTAR
jgi:hypothetical protein